MENPNKVKGRILSCSGFKGVMNRFQLERKESSIEQPAVMHSSLVVLD